MMGRVGIEPTTLGLRVRPSVLQRTAGGGISLQTAAPGHAASRDEQQATEPNTYAHSYAHWHPRSISRSELSEDLRRRELPKLTLVRPLSGQTAERSSPEQCPQHAPTCPTAPQARATVLSPRPLPRAQEAPPFGRGLVDQLSSRILTVSMCWRNEVALPPSKVHTWAVFTRAGAPVSLCFQARWPSATTVSPSATNCSGTTANSSPISASRMKTPSTTACGPT